MKNFKFEKTKNVGNRIKELRGEKTQVDFLKELEIHDILSESILTKNEKNQIQPSMDLLVAICSHHHMNLDEIAFCYSMTEVRDFKDIYSKLDERKQTLLVETCLSLANQVKKDRIFDIYSDDDFDVKKLDWQIRLAEIRKSKKWTAEKFKEQIGKSIKVAYYHENKEELPPFAYCCKFACGMEISLDYLFNGTYYSYPTPLSDVLYDYKYDKQKEIISLWADEAKKFIEK